MTLPTLTTVFDSYQMSLLETYIDNKIATGLPYKNYIANLYQTDTDDPTAVFEYNNTGLTFNWVYVSDGVYSATINQVLDTDKIILPAIGINTSGITYANLSVGIEGSTTVFNINSSNSGVPTNLDGTISVQIYIYP